jgi:putative ABC transport system permease protein
MRTWKIIQLALGGLRRTPLRLTLTALGVTVASGALVSMVAFALGVQRQAEAPFQKLGLLNHIEVSPTEGEKPHDAPVLDDAALARMESLPGVAIAYPDFRVAGLKIIHGPDSQTVLALGLPRVVPLVGSPEGLLVAGRFFSPDDTPEVVLSQRLVDDLGFDSPEAAVGAAVTLEASGLTPEEAERFAFQRKEFAVKIVGVYGGFPMMRGPAGRTVLLPVDLMKQIPGVRFAPALDHLRAGGDAASAGYSRATVQVRDRSDLAPVEKAIREMGFDTRTMLSRFEEMRAFFVFLDVLLAAVGTVALVVAGLGIINTLLMSVLERYQEIGIYKAIGASDGDLVVLFLTEAGIIGLLGGLGGLALGRAVSWILEIAVGAYARSQGVTVPLSVFAFPVWLLAATVLFSVAISVTAGVYPALRAARVDPIRALRRE